MVTPTEQTHTSTTRDREVIVTNNGSNNGMSSAIVAIFAVVAILLVGWIGVNAFTSDGGEIIPDEITINTDDGGSTDSGSTDSGSTDSGSTESGQ